jgi:hypothetical protein
MPQAPDRSTSVFVRYMAAMRIAAPPKLQEVGETLWAALDAVICSGGVEASGGL